MITLFCVFAAFWAQKNNKETFGWGFGAFFAWMPDLAFLMVIFG